MDLKSASKLLSWFSIVVLIVCAGVAGPAAEDEKKDDLNSAGKAEKKVDEEDEVLVFTNADLKRLFGEPEEEAPTAPAEAEAPPDGEDAAQPVVRPVEPAAPEQAQRPTDPLKWMEERKARRAEWQRQVAEAEKAVAEARQKVSDLEYRLRATRNPFLARPEVSEEEREEWDVKTASERAEATQTQLEQARTELADAEQSLARLREQTR